MSTENVLRQLGLCGPRRIRPDDFDCPKQRQTRNDMLRELGVGNSTLTGKLTDKQTK